MAHWAGRWVLECHLVSNLGWQEALIYSTQEPLPSLHPVRSFQAQRNIWPFPDAQADERALL